MKPTIYRVHYAPGLFRDFARRCDARGFAMIRKAHGDSVSIEGMP